METIAGFIEHIIYRNAENGYTVLNLIDDDEEQITCVGSFQVISEGEFIEAQGSFGEHQMYGQQFQIEKYELKTPEDEISIERYLASGAIKGIGAALAARIVRRFKADTFRIVENEPERLAEIKGISEKKAREIAEQMEEKKELRQAMIFLQKYGITTNLSIKIYSKYGNEIYQVLKENPYRMADEIQGIGFKIADEIAARVGIHTDSDFRIKSGILYTILQATAEGHTYLPYDELKKRASEMLEIAEENLESQFMNLAMERKIVIKEVEEQKNVYASQYYYLELNVAKMLHDLNVKYEVEEKAVEKRLQEIEDRSEIELDEMQRNAVIESVKNGLMILTGGPGTGKTTTINAMIKFFESEDLDIFLAAPTGRAAKRMTEATGYEAKTIHRLLELSGGLSDTGGRVNFEKNEENPLEADAIIIDEMSMVDIHLIHALLRAVTIGTRVILVGDINQLPSVGPGSVLKNMIQSNQFSVVMLKKIFRQASQSDIVVNAHKINDGQEVVLDNKSKDFFFLKRSDANVIISVMITLIQKKLPPYVNAQPYDIQVLTPMRKGMLGVERLNSILQEYLNPPGKNKREKEVPGGKFREGDKVMQIKNNYQIEWEVCNSYGLTLDRGTGVFNGDMGVIKEINLYAENLTVEYDEGRRVEYSFKQLEELELAYAITIHKSQGSEYPAVIIPLLNGPQMLMNRNLLYTAVTRAKSCVTLVGNDETFFRMIDNTSEQTRYSGLKERILELEKFS